MKLFGKERMINRVVLIDVGMISPNPYQPRQRFDPKAMRELADSISQSGLLQPITVRQTEVGYELIAGERRLVACRMLALERIPAIVEQFDDERSATFSLIENLQRKDLNFFEEAQGIQQMMQLSGISQQEVADRLGKAQSTVANKLRLLAFSTEMRRRMLDAGLTERHARALLKFPDEKSVSVALAHIVNHRLNVGESERYIDELIAGSAPVDVPEAVKTKPATRLFVVKDLRIFMNTIDKAVSTMKLAGIDIDTEKNEDEEYIHYSLKIPKKAVRQTHSA